MKEKYGYRGNGERHDKLDQALVKELNRKKLYIEVIFIHNGLYILGGGRAVKLKMGKDRILVQSSNTSHLNLEDYLV